MPMQASLVLSLKDIAPSDLGRAGGKGVNLGRLARLDGVRVPVGFCVTTEAFLRVLSGVPSLDERLESLRWTKPDDTTAVQQLSTDLRRSVEEAPIPEDVAADVLLALDRLASPGVPVGYAVRSSATAEDLATASFAGQHDTFLNVIGPTAVIEHIRRAWASLFSERAVAYRLRRGIDPRVVRMAVVVQQMVDAEVAGVLFTADPVTGNRKVTSIDAGFGLGEALVSGRANPDVYKVIGEEVVAKTIATKHFELQAASTGRTSERPVAAERQRQQVLNDEQIVRLAQMGRRIEAHFGCPQDIEWCLANGEFSIVQSRPITTLFPVPASNDGENHVYVSVGHQQMMTDAMKPLGLSLWNLTTPAPMSSAGGRLFVDVTRALASSASRSGVLDTLGKSDPLIRDALESILARGDFIQMLPDCEGRPEPGGVLPKAVAPEPGGVTALIERAQASLIALQRDVLTKSGPELFDFILTDLQELKRLLFDPQSHQAVMASMTASWWLNEKLEAWLGDKRVADVLTQSVPHNITSQMGLDLLDVADVLRPHKELVSFLQNVESDALSQEGALDELQRFPGGQGARAAIDAWLEKYGMRGVGEIDVTRPRFSERPSMLVPLLLNNVRNVAPGESRRRFEKGLAEARDKEQEILGRLRAFPDGAHKVEETRRTIDQLRAFSGYREFPKYAQVSRYFVYKQALSREADDLVRTGVLRARDDIFYLTFQELHEVVRSRRIDEGLIARRKEEFTAFQELKPPRVLTSDGEMLNGSYRRDDVPPGALVGLPVSAGTVEGRARVVLDPTRANFEPGDILVTRYTDPSWTPALVAIAGLVTEVGGLTTHGSVIAREYGLPAVVGVERATQRIPDGQRVRVNGTDGTVEVLSNEAHGA